MTFRNFTFALLFPFCFTMCNRNHCKPNIFKHIELNELKDSIFLYSISNCEMNDLTYCGYDIDLKFWDTYPLVYIYNPKSVINCSILEQSDSVFFKNKQEDKMQFLFNISNERLDSGSIIWDSYLYSDSDSILKVDTFAYSVQDIFFSQKYSSRVYKIKIHKYSYFSFINNKRDLILYLCIDYGIIGAYISYNRSENTSASIDTVFTYTGDIFISKYDSCCMDFEIRGEYE